jgi:glucose/arabinose dehydrogenase
MKHAFALTAILLGLESAAPAQEKPKVLVEGLKKPVAVAIGPGGHIFILDQGNGTPGSGALLRVDKDGTTPIAKGFWVPRCLVVYQKWLFFVDRGTTRPGGPEEGLRLLRVDVSGKVEELISAKDLFQIARTDGATSITADPETGTLYLLDQGGVVFDERREGAIYRITPNGKKSVVATAKSIGGLPCGLVLDGQSHLLVTVSQADAASLIRVNIANGTSETVADGLKSSSMTWDPHGRLLLLPDQIILRPGERPRPIKVLDELKKAEKAENVDLMMKALEWLEVWRRIRGVFCLDATGKNLLFIDDGIRGLGGIDNPPALLSVPITALAFDVDETPMPLQTMPAFPNLEWTGWKGETAKGQANPLRPMVLTHAGDGSNRVFVATEHGVIHVFNNDQKPQKTSIFLDIQDRVVYRDDQNEEGFLGLAFHPKYKENGEFFVFYTTKKAKQTNVLSRFKVSKDDPNKADPNSEEELMRFEKPFWNHDGGTLCFGPDGYLYLTHGDGGSFNDPFDNGQNLKSLLGKVHRIDVDHKDAGKNYAIPKDNPFVSMKDARPEIWAYGLRNIWRMSFDRKTGQLWAGDVGQNLYEEIDLIEKGGNYGWNRREGLHPFGPKGRGYSKEFIDPIWEYHHDVGKCIIGGHVYRGPRLPELDGYYLYGDYVSNKIWALRYDEAKKRVVANRPIKDRNLPMFSFGEDEKGEVYMLTPSVDGKSIWWLTKP